MYSRCANKLECMDKLSGLKLILMRRSSLEKPDEGTSDGIHHLDIVRWWASYTCGGTHSCTRVAPQEDLGRLTWVRGHLWMGGPRIWKLMQVHLPCKLIHPEGENVEKTDVQAKSYVCGCYLVRFFMFSNFCTQQQHSCCISKSTMKPL